MTSLMLITRCQTLWGDPLESLSAWLSKALQCVLSWLLQVEQLGGETPLQLTVSRAMLSRNCVVSPSCATYCGQILTTANTAVLSRLSCCFCEFIWFILEKSMQLPGQRKVSQQCGWASSELAWIQLLSAWDVRLALCTSAKPCREGDVCQCCSDGKVVGSPAGMEGEGWLLCGTASFLHTSATSTAVSERRCLLYCVDVLGMLVIKFGNGSSDMARSLVQSYW